jgi:hypothetical protein
LKRVHGRADVDSIVACDSFERAELRLLAGSWHAQADVSVARATSSFADGSEVVPAAIDRVQMIDEA